MITFLNFCECDLEIVSQELPCLALVAMFHFFLKMSCGSNFAYLLSDRIFGVRGSEK